MKDYIIKAIVPLLSVLIGVVAGTLLTRFTESALQFEKRRSETIFNLLEPIRKGETLEDAIRRAHLARVRFAVYASPESLNALAELMRHGCVNPTPPDMDISQLEKQVQVCEDKFVRLVATLRWEVGADRIRMETLIDALGFKNTIDLMLK